MSLQLKKLAGVGYATDELLADTTALGNIMTQGFSEELTFLVEDSIINGTGAGQPLGVLGSNALVTVAKETGQAAATLVTANIFKMWSRMWSRSRANAVWFVNQDIEPQLLSLDMPVGTGGMPVYLPANGISGAPFGTLLGRPIVPIEYCATLGTVGDVILADLSQYVMIEKGGLQAETSIHVQFLTDETAYRFVYRVDGQPAWHDTLTPFKGSSTQSPFVALATRA
jgi:HK97 family phage major capsid protein